MVEGIEYRWSGEVMEPVDGLAFIGRNPMDSDNVFIATGDSGNGMTHGTIAGILLTDLIVGRKNDWEEIYDPSRITLRALGEFAKENLNVAVQYTDLVVAGDVDSVDEIKPNDGAVISRGLQEGCSLSRPGRKGSRILGGLPAPGLHRQLELAGEELGLSVSRLALRRAGHVTQGPANSDLEPVKSEE